MKEILFKGKTKSGEWVYGSLILAGTYCCILEPEENVHPLDYPYLDDDLGTIDGQATPVIPETVCQFTGYTDKNGMKIFEGDFIKGYHPIWNKHMLCQVVYDFDTFGYRMHKGDDWLAHISNLDDIEVIGNIYDNPEYADCLGEHT